MPGQKKMIDSITKKKALSGILTTLQRAFSTLCEEESDRLALVM